MDNGDERRRSTRVNFGVASDRFGDFGWDYKSRGANGTDQIPENTDSQPQAQGWNTNEKENGQRQLPPAPTVQKAKSNASIASKRSTNSTILKNKVDLSYSESLAKLEEEEDTLCATQKRKEKEIKYLEDLIDGAKSVLKNDKLTPEDKTGHQAELKKLEDELKVKSLELDYFTIEYEVKLKSINRKKSLLKKRTDYAKQEIEEESDGDPDKLSNPETVTKKVTEWKISPDANPPDEMYRQQELEDAVARLDQADMQAAELKATVDRLNQAQEQAAYIHYPPKVQQQPVVVTSQFLARQSQRRDLPDFSGRPEEWISFVTAYKESTKICGFSDSENMERLRKCLKNEAARVVECLMVTPLNLSEVWETLEMHFGQTDHIIQNLIVKAKNVPSVKSDQMLSLIEFGTAVRNLAATMRALNCNEHLTNPQLLKDMESKLPGSMQLEYREWLQQDISRMKNILTFAEWIKNKTKLACAIAPPRLISEKLTKAMNNEFDNRRPPRNRKSEHALVVEKEEKEPEKPKNDTREKYCHCCGKKGHRIQGCTNFSKDSVENRRKLAKEKRLCFCCLNLGHSYRDCRSKQKCKKDGCDKNHHTLLHFDHPKPIVNPHEEQQEQIEAVIHAVEVKGEILYQVVPVTLKGPKGLIKTYALLDTGAGITTIDSTIAKELGLEGIKRVLKYTGLTNQVEFTESETIELDLISQNNETFHLINVKTVQNLMLPSRSRSKKSIMRWAHLKGLDLCTYKNARPMILIGQDHADLIIPFERIDGPSNSPIAARTKLGWVLNGNMPPTLELPQENSILITQDNGDWNYLHQLIKNHFTTEDFGVKLDAKKPISSEDHRAIEVKNHTLKRVGERFEAGLLWKEDNLVLPESKPQTMKRLITIEKKMDRDPEFARKYIEKFIYYLHNGFIRKLTPEEIVQGGGRLWYLPHFAVSKSSKPGKIRLVHDAAAKCHGYSLNDFLLKGLDNLTPLMSVLFKFRERAIGITGDIKDMYHQVLMREEDQNSQRFLWRGSDRDREPDEYVITRMFFGAACSPSLAQEAKNQNAKNHQTEFPKASQAIITKHYVDDYLDSQDTPEETYKLFKDVCEVHRRGGFHICNWICSSKEVTDMIPEQLRATPRKIVSMDSEQSQIERVLGLHWMPEEDIFTFLLAFDKIKEDVKTGQRVPTKREALSLLMSIYDPLGYLAHFTVKGKILMQGAWRLAINWDDELPATIHERWFRWLYELQKIETFQVPRCYSPYYSTSSEIQLHIFNDASEQAFCSVAYFRIQTENKIEVAFVCAKTRVAPLKPLSIPRLELQAAVMGCRLAETIKSNHEVISHRTVYWTDSSTVMRWLRSDGKNFKQFVSHRIGEIQEFSELTDWKWLPTKENVADEATRDDSPCDWSRESRWLNGPAFLKLPEAQWPKEESAQTRISDADLELKVEALCLTVPKGKLFDPIHFSSWRKLIRTTAYLHKFWIYYIFKDRPVKLSIEDLDTARLYWLRQSQEESFWSEICCLKNNKEIEKNSRLIKLSPYLDEAGMLRVKGRINAAENVPITVKNPIILDPKDTVTRLIINDFHVRANHHGQERVVNEIRQQFYVIHLRTAVRSAWNHCQKCKNDRAEPAVPQMGQLPSCRLASYQRPFTITGMDYFGPMEVLVGYKRHEKRYGVLFTCMSTRAIHVEIANSLSTDSCIMAIRRFAARRGCPVEIHSDNGTNLRGANNELKAALQEIDEDQMYSRLTNKGIKWSFIPPASPHMGGTWERLVKSFKVAVYATLKDRYPREEVLATLMTEAEHSVNSRPLTYLSLDHESEEALTPNHFLIGGSGNMQPPGKFDDTDLYLKKKWRTAQRLADHLWSRWVHEYRPTLVARQKWHKTQNPVKVGDVAIIIDPRMTRNSWPKGIITKVFPGNDGQVRVVDVKTTCGTYRRPIAKIAILDVRREEDAELAEQAATRKQNPIGIVKNKKTSQWQKIMEDYKLWFKKKSVPGFM